MMSDSIIADGTGKGYKAKVSVKNRLSVDSVNVEEVTHISSTEGGSYQFHFERTFLAANTFETVGHIVYTGEYKLQISSMTTSREDVALSPDGQAVVEIMSNVDYTSGGALTAPININLASSNILEATVYSGTTTLVIDTTDEVEILDVAFQNVHTHEFKGALILAKGDKIGIIGKSKNIGDLLHTIIFAYEVKEVI